MERLGYIVWRWRMWTMGFGSYNEIDWAVRWHILRPYHHHERTAGLRKWIIRKFAPAPRAGESEER